ncbi:MAG: hypothetical protein QNJ67_13025 [Kiloniellales bacterium]|nr:hypothetical protein [Kiloniellales bacterium]
MGASDEDSGKVATIARGGWMEAGLLLFDSSGKIIKRRGDGPVRFAFEYRDAPYDVEVDIGAEPELRLTGRFGALPFTAECPEVRQLVLKLVEASHNMKRGRLSVNAKKEIELQARAVPPNGGSPDGIMAVIVALLLETQPCVALLKDLLAARPIMPPIDEEADPSENLRAAT